MPRPRDTHVGLGRKAGFLAEVGYFRVRLGSRTGRLVEVDRKRMAVLRALLTRGARLAEFRERDRDRNRHLSRIARIG